MRRSKPDGWIVGGDWRLEGTGPWRMSASALIHSVRWDTSSVQVPIQHRQVPECGEDSKSVDRMCQHCAVWLKWQVRGDTLIATSALTCTLGVEYTWQVLREGEEVMDVPNKLHNFQLRSLDTDWVTPRVPFEKLIVPQLVEKFAPFYKTNNPLLVPVLSQINQVHAPNPLFLISILILSHVCLGLTSGLFPSVFPPKPRMYIPHGPQVLPSLIWPLS
jgi:hypothetical protein